MRRKLVAALVVLIALAGGGYVALRWLLVSDVMRAELERQLSAYLQQPVRIKSASAAIVPKVAVELHDVVIGEPPAIGLGDVQIVTGLRPLLSRRIEQAEVRISTGRVSLPLRFTLTPEVGPAVSTPASSLGLISIRAIELRDITLVSGGQEWDVDADCAVAGDRLDVSQLSATSSTTRLKASGALTSISGLNGEFTASAEALGVDELLAFGSGLSAPVAATAAAPAASAPMHIVVALTAAAGRLAGYDFRGLTTTAAITPAGISLSPLTVSAFGGSYSGRLDVTTGRSTAMKLAGRVESLDVPQLLQAAGSQGGITGSLGGTVSLTASGTETQALLRTARGSIAATIVNGTMPRLDVVRPIVLAFGKPSGAPPAGSGSAFSRLGGTFAVADGTMASDDLTMTSRDFDLAGSSRVHLASGGLSGRANVVLSSELSAQAGVDLRRYAQEDGRVIVPATFGGTLQQPTVALDVAAATRRALTNELERRTRSLLEGLFKRKK